MAAKTVCGEEVTWPMYTSKGIYLSQPIGFGPDGGSLNISVSLKRGTGDAVVLSVVPLSVVSSWPDLEEGLPAFFDLAAQKSAFLQLFEKDINASLELPVTLLPEAYYVIVQTPLNQVNDDDLTSAGLLSVDYRQRNGSWLMFQLRRFDIGVSVLLNLVIATGVLIFANFFMNVKLLSRLHAFYGAAVLYTAIFLYVLMESIDAERLSGTRSPWAPSMLQKGFDVIEVLIYVLTSLGFKTMRASLTPNEIQIISIGTVLSLVIGGFETACGDDRIECGSFTSARMVIHMFGLLVAIVAFNFHLDLASSYLRESSIASVDTAKMYSRKAQFWWLRAIFLGYIIQPTIAVVLKTQILDWYDDWIFLTFFWGSKVALLLAVMIVFSPRKVRMPIVEVAIRERRRLGGPT